MSNYLLTSVICYTEQNIPEQKTFVYKIRREQGKIEGMDGNISPFFEAQDFL